jgi:hypothetical protein
MKIGLGMAAVGLAAGATFYAVGGGKSEEPAKPPAAAEKKSKFDIPVWHPDARWRANGEAFIGSGSVGQLDGPRLDIMFRLAGCNTGRLWVGEHGGPYGCFSYDPDLERTHLAAGSARGFLDGPFSRARFHGGWTYLDEPSCASSPDGRYFFVAESKTNRIRRMDLEKQQVASIPWPTGTYGVNLLASKGGKLYVVTSGGDLHACDIDGKSEKTVRLQIPGAGRYLLDEVNDRLYWATYFNPKTKWFVGYFDMKAGDGVFHGVLPTEPPNGIMSGGAVPGPFKGFKAYPHVFALWFGPDDPDRNFIYMDHVDTAQLYRLDLKKEEVGVLSCEADGARFIFSGKGKGDTKGRFDDNGDVVESWRYRRVK